MTDEILGVIGLILILNLFRRGYFILRRPLKEDPDARAYSAHGVFHRISGRDTVDQPDGNDQ
jgi:hypothetical protein